MNRAKGLTLTEIMIAAALLATVLAVMNQIIAQTSTLQSTATSKDALSADVVTVWSTLNSDLSQSSWYIPDTTINLTSPNLAVDRGLFYLPYVVQPRGALLSASPGFTTNPALAIFNRNGADDIRYGQLQVDGISSADLDTVLPGMTTDRSLNPADAFPEGTYGTTYFGPSQELIFCRSATSAWNHVTNRPSTLVSQAPRDIQPPAEPFPGTDVDWMTPGTYGTTRVLYPTAFVSSSTPGGAIVWNQRPDVTMPYGKVMGSVWLDGDFALQPQLELIRQPDFQSFVPGDVRLMGYQIVPSPLGMGRLVRTYVAPNPATLPIRGTEVGQYIARNGANYLIVDKILSDNVIRVLFETARHSDTLGINGIRVTIFFARVNEMERKNALIIRRSVTMIFAMRSQNTPSDQERYRGLIKTNATPGTGAIPFTY